MDKFTNEVRSEINKHKWIESEKAGKDIGEKTARINWLINHWGAFKTYYDRKEAEIIKESGTNE